MREGRSISKVVKESLQGCWWSGRARAQGVAKRKRWRLPKMRSVKHVMCQSGILVRRFGHYLPTEVGFYAC